MFQRPPQAANRRSTKRAWLGAAVVGSALLVAFFAFMSLRDDPAAPGATITEVGAAHAAEAATARHAEPAPENEASHGEPAPAASATTKDSLDARNDTEAKARTEKPQTTSTGSLASRAVGPSRPVKNVATPVGPRDTAAAEGEGTSTTAFQMGQDLKAAGKRQQHGIDESNPFR